MKALSSNCSFCMLNAFLIKMNNMLFCWYCKVSRCFLQAIKWKENSLQERERERSLFMGLKVYNLARDTCICECTSSTKPNIYCSSLNYFFSEIENFLSPSDILFVERVAQAKFLAKRCVLNDKTIVVLFKKIIKSTF